MVVAIFGTPLIGPDETSSLNRGKGTQQGSLPNSRLEKCIGSGVVIDESGLVLTSNDIVKKAGRLTVKLFDGRKAPVTRLGWDPDLDVALLRIEESGYFQAAGLGDASSLRVGQTVAVISNPAGLEHAFKVGMICGLNRYAGVAGIPGLHAFVPYIQTDAMLDKGSLGSPLFDADGKVVGIGCKVHTVIHGMGFAVPIDLVNELLPKLKKGWKGRPWLGVELLPPLDAGDELGPVVSKLVPGGPMDSAGIMAGDRIMEFAGYAVADRERLKQILENAEPGKPVRVKIRRDQKELELSVTPAIRP
ncbi:MAG: PDZ domain-containing protein [Deltaproteobacteria bacterium]|nr:PDZ domain-containing protein [Deltaproteobacteria bacterium]